MYEKYQKLRDDKGISDYKVAKEAGIPYSTLKDWAKGIYQPKIDKIMKIANYFDVPLEYFYAN